MDEVTIQSFWNSHPCGESFVVALDKSSQDDYDRFFREYDAWKYKLEDHIPACLDGLHVDGKQVLEIGTGEGAEAEQLIRRGAKYSGVDLTPESIDRVRTRLAIRDLSYDRVENASVLDLPFEDNSFDMVFSHGVLHHVPDIQRAQEEIHRVLRPGGELVVMMYARWSLNYLVAIGAVRRAGLLVAYPFVSTSRSRTKQTLLRQHVANAREMGLWRYLTMKEFVNTNTDGPGNPFSRVYDEARLARDFPQFEVTRSYKRFMHAPPLPVHGLPGGERMGWHLWAHLRPR
jgi:SAM-dependent methyltransferase